jgi:hypothetical protein
MMAHPGETKLVSTPTRVRDRPRQPRIAPQNEYLAAENRILRSHLPARLCWSDPEKSALAEIGKRLGRNALAQVACLVERIPAGGTTGLWAHRPISVIRSQVRLSECPEASWYRAGTETEPKHDVEGIHSIAYCRSGRYRFLYGRGSQLARISYVLRFVLYSPGKSPRQFARDHATPLIRRGCGRWPAMRPARVGDSCTRGGMLCMIATRSSAHCSERRERLEAYNRFTIDLVWRSLVAR